MASSLSKDQFSQLFAENHRRVFRFVRSLVPARDDAEEVFQETCVILWREAEKFVPGTNFTAWALAMAFNQVRSYRHRRLRDKFVFHEGLLEKLAADEGQRSEELDARSRALDACLELLPATDAEVISAYYETRTTVREVSERLNRPVNTIYKALQRIRRALRDCVTMKLASVR